MAERARSGRTMARPELCVLLAYAKRSLQHAIGSSTLPDDPFLDNEVRRYFPAPVVERFGHLIAQHPLRRDLAAMLIANAIVNDLGVTWASRLGAETGAEPAEVARAYWIARYVTGAERRWADVEALDGKIDPVTQNVLMVGVDTLVEDVARWYLLSAPGAPLGETIEEAAPIFSTLSAAIESAGSDAWREAREAIVRQLVAEGVPEELARRHAYQPELAHGPDIIAVTKATGRTLDEVASAFYLAGERFHLDWLEHRLVELPDGSRFDRWATQAVGDDLMTLRRDIALRVLDSADGRPIPRAMEDYLERRSEPYERLNRLVNSLSAQGESSLAALTVALRQVRGWSGISKAPGGRAQRPCRRHQAAKLHRPAEPGRYGQGARRRRARAVGADAKLRRRSRAGTGQGAGGRRAAAPEAPGREARRARRARYGLGRPRPA